MRKLCVDYKEVEKSHFSYGKNEKNYVNSYKYVNIKVFYYNMI